ncbi:MAG: patatin-like phospholipase family protein [Deltaproteobacteria bacterium]|nr:patatin-like phospholipase family protein [Deltaproteobacteria bacterium]
MRSSAVERGVAVFLPCVLVCAQAWAQSPAAATSTPSVRTENLALTISGGVSLGVYEAGLNWAIARTLRSGAMTPAGSRFDGGAQLIAVTGASAGSVNSLMVAALWCSVPGNDESVDANLMRDIWIDVGLDELLPGDPKLYDTGDGLLSSRAMMASLRHLNQEVFSPQPKRKFRPGCRVSFGLSVTRAHADVVDVGGLRVMQPHFVVPMVFEVTPAGRPRVRFRQLSSERESAGSILQVPSAPDPEPPGESLPVDSVFQSLLASAAFPIAFGPRALCSCRSDCAPDEVVTDPGQCGGPGIATQPPGLSCKSLPRQPGKKLQLCKRMYVDGGVFDNAPIGLAIDLAESDPQAKSNNITYGFVDPDVRRLQPEEPPQAPASAEGLGGTLRLFGDLIATARNEELRRAIVRENWNRSISNVLRDNALTLAHLSTVHARLARLWRFAPPPAEDFELPDGARPDEARLHRGAVLSLCSTRKAGTLGDDASARLLTQCADASNGATVPELEALLERSPKRWGTDELLEVATFVGGLLGPAVRQRTREALQDQTLDSDERLAFLPIFRDRVRFAAAAQLFLSDEVAPSLWRSLSDKRAQRLREALLQTAQLTPELVRDTAAFTNALVDRRLQGLSKSGSSALALETENARETIAGLEYGELFSPDTLASVGERVEALLLDPAVQAAQVMPPAVPISEAQRLVSWRWQTLGGVGELVPYLRRLSSRADAVRADALALRKEATAERSLALSTRFAPLAGSQLGNFAGFLDRPLREYDYYAGVYDGVRQMAAQLCQAQDPYDHPFPLAERRADAPSTLKVRSEATQRCLGAAMQHLMTVLGVVKSERAMAVLPRLARLEVEASMQVQADADRVLASAEWRWLDDLGLRLLNDPLDAVLRAATSKRKPCTHDDADALCLVDLTFDEFLAALDANGYRPSDQSMKAVIKDRGRWWNTMVQRTLDRAASIELGQSSTPTSEGVLTAVSAGEVVTRRMLSKQPFPSLDRDPSTVPGDDVPRLRSWTRFAAHLIPYRLALDVAKGGIALSWVEPEWWFSDVVSVPTIFQAVDYEHARARFNTVVGLRPTLHLFGLSLGVGPRLAFHWQNEIGPEVGAEVRLAGVQDRFALTLGARTLRTNGSLTFADGFIALEIADLNGLVFWLTPWGRAHSAAAAATAAEPAAAK